MAASPAPPRRTSDMSKSERVAVGVVVLIGGAVLMALEVTAFRIIGKTYGTALRETTAVITVFLAAMSAGYYLGGRAGDRRPQLATLGWVLVLAAPLMLVVIGLEKRATESIAASEAWPALHAFAAATLLFAAPTVLLASISPIAVRLLSTHTDHSGRVAGGISALSTFGSIAGTVITAFVLLDLIGSIRLTLVVLSATTLCLAGILAAASLHRPRSKWVRGAVVTGVGTGILIGIIALEQHPTNSEFATTTSRTRLLYERDTAYHHIRVVERPPGIRELYFGATQQSSYRLGDASLRGLPYEEFKHFAKVARPGIKDVLLIGLGGGTSARQFHGFYPDVTIDAVDIDPVVIDVAEKFFDVRRSDRLRLHAGDGRTFVRKSPKRYDLISIDAYTHGRYGSTIPPHVVTREFFEEVSSKLNDGGICHFHSYAARNTRFTRALYKTLKEVFPSVVMLGETELIASTAPLFVDADHLRARSAELRKRLPEIEARFATLTTAPLPTHDVPVLTDDFAPVDTLLRGIAVTR